MHRLLHWLRARFTADTIGAQGERRAARHLRRLGYRVLGCNLRSRGGEVDILAEAPDRRTVVVVEVKSSATDHEVGPAAATRPEVHVNRDKQRRLVALACQLARRYKLADRPIRFDVIAVDLPAGREPVIRHHQGAFQSHV